MLLILNRFVKRVKLDSFSFCNLLFEDSCVFVLEVQ